MQLLVQACPVFEPTETGHQGAFDICGRSTDRCDRFIQLLLSFPVAIDVQVDPIPFLGELCREGQGAQGTVAADQDGEPSFRSREQDGFFQLVMLPGVIQWLRIIEDACAECQLFGQHGEAGRNIRVRDAVIFVLAVHPTGPEAQNQAPAAQVIDGAGVTQRHHRVAEGDRADERTEFDAFGGLCGISQRDP